MNDRQVPWWLMLLTILYGGVLFFWLSVEDSGWVIVGFGIALSVLCSLHIIFRQRDLAHRMLLFTVAGGLTGAGGIIATLGLMLLKTSLHGHEYPDYSFPLMVSMARRLPAWAIAGTLIGLAVTLVTYRFDGSDDPGGLS